MSADTTQALFDLDGSVATDASADTVDTAAADTAARDTAAPAARVDTAAVDTALVEPPSSPAQRHAQRMLEALRVANEALLDAALANAEDQDGAPGRLALGDAQQVAEAVGHIAEELPDLLALVGTATTATGDTAVIAAAGAARRTANELLRHVMDTMRETDPDHGPHARTVGGQG